MITEEKEERRARILKGAAFKIRVSDKQEATWKGQFDKKPKKTADEILAAVQARMRKFQSGSTNGKVWDEDWKALSAKILTLVTGKSKQRRLISS